MLAEKISIAFDDEEKASPLYCAMTVPRATPRMSQFSTITKMRLQTMLTMLSMMAIHIGSREFCMPINHPLTA